MRDSTGAFACIILGFVSMYVEMILPGWVLPAVAGASMVMLGVASLAAFPPQPFAMVVLVASAALIWLDAKWRAKGVLALCGGIAMTAGARLLVSPPHRVRWWAAALSIPFAILSARLLTVALIARQNKMAP